VSLNVRFRRSRLVVVSPPLVAERAKSFIRSTREQKFLPLFGILNELSTMRQTLVDQKSMSRRNRSFQSSSKILRWDGNLGNVGYPHGLLQKSHFGMQMPRHVQLQQWWETLVHSIDFFLGVILREILEAGHVLKLCIVLSIEIPKPMIQSSRKSWTFGSLFMRPCIFLLLHRRQWRNIPRCLTVLLVR
jgi:hypothetical protein